MPSTYTQLDTKSLNCSPLLPLVWPHFDQIYGYLANDRIPLYICKHRGRGIWQPVYRLHTLWLPGLFGIPLALGLFGASLQYHLHYLVLALACFFLWRLGHKFHHPSHCTLYHRMLQRPHE